VTIPDRRILPAAQTILVDGAGRATQPFYDFLRRLVDATSLTPELVAEVQQLLQQMEQLQDGGFMPATSNVIGDDSIVSTGVLSNGVVMLELQGDTSDQRSTWYYGTNATNEKGWHRFYTALETGAGILKRNSGYVELGEVDDASDLPLSGNPGEAYWVRGAGDIDERGLWVWDADAGEWALDTEASGIVGFEIAEGDYGDISVSDEGATWTINNNAVSDAKLRDSAALSVIGRASNSTGDPADIVASVDKAVLHRNGTSLAFAPIDHTYISDFAEAAQDAVGGILANSADIEFTYDDSAGEISAELSSTVHASLALADSALQPGDNISELANDANYVASGDNVSVLVNDAGYLVAEDLAAVAFSGDYDDLINTPTIPPDISSATFITADDETATLANSLKLVAGSNVTFDTSTPGELKISASGGGGGGTVESVIGTTNEIDVDSSDPANPVVSLANAVRASLALADSAVQPGDLADVAFSGDYSSLTGIPSTFPPSAHTHGDSEITSLAWSKLTGVPATFTPSAHTHSASDINVGTLADARLSSNIPRLNASQTITGVWTFQGVPSFNAGGGALQLKPGSADYVYMSLYARSATPGVRSGIIGYTAAGGTELEIRNEISGGPITLRTNNGAISLAGTTVTVNGVNVRDAAILTSGSLDPARVPQSAVTQHQNALSISAAQITSGTLSNSRLSGVLAHQGSIGAGDDLNTYTTTGIWHQNLDANAASGTNYPVPLAGMLRVYASSMMVYQEYFAYGVNATYIRKHYNGVWQPWHQVYDSGHKPSLTDLGAAAANHTHSASDITSGTISGNVSINGALGINAGGGALVLRAGSQDRVFMQFFADSDNPNTRSGYFGFAFVGDTRLDLVNEMAGGVIHVGASSQIRFSAPSIVVQGRGGVLHYADSALTNGRVFVQQGGSPVGTQEGDITIIW